jgi:quinol monooxygenase YgiN|nr:antibiotic biosynthesis monooxygenase [Candidatus Acidoferrales bacterium]
MILISLTRLRVRSSLYMPLFLWHSSKSSRQAERADGFLGGRVLPNPRKVFWTLTAWESEAAMNFHRTNAVHRAAMPKLLHWCDDATVVH